MYSEKCLKFFPWHEKRAAFFKKHDRQGPNTWIFCVGGFRIFFLSIFCLGKDPGQDDKNMTGLIQLIFLGFLFSFYYFILYFFKPGEDFKKGILWTFITRLRVLLRKVLWGAWKSLGKKRRKKNGKNEMSSWPQQIIYLFNIG